MTRRFLLFPSRSGKPASSERRAEELAARFPPLLVAAERVAETVAGGIHGRRRSGAGETFWQFRRYEAGDEPRLIDWRKSAKSDPVFVREMEWEAAQTIFLWRDCTSSMEYHSQKALPEKRERAELLLLALAALLLRGGENVALLGGDSALARDRNALAQIALRLNETAGGNNQNETAGLPLFTPLPRHARLVLIGDFLGPVDKTAALGRSFAARGVSGQIVQILDPAEETLPFSGRVRFEGMENEGAIVVGRVETLRAAYQDRIKAHGEALRDIALDAGWGFTRHHTDAPPQTALMALYQALDSLPGTLNQDLTGTRS